MSSSSILKAAIFLLAATVSLPLRASDFNKDWKLKTGIRLNKSHKSLDRARAFVQRSPDFSLRTEDKEVRPKAVGEIFRREKIDGERLLLSARSQGLEGWAPATSVVALSEAEPFFSRAIVQFPRSSFAYLMRGTVRLVNDEIDCALADLNEAIRLDPKSASALHMRGLVWQFKDRPDEALADLNKSLELDPRSPDALGDRGMMYASARRSMTRPLPTLIARLSWVRGRRRSTLPRRRFTSSGTN